MRLKRRPGNRAVQRTRCIRFRPKVPTKYIIFAFYGYAYLVFHLLGFHTVDWGKIRQTIGRCGCVFGWSTTSNYSSSIEDEPVASLLSVSCFRLMSLSVLMPCSSNSFHFE